MIVHRSPKSKKKQLALDNRNSHKSQQLQRLFDAIGRVAQRESTPFTRVGS
jgi:hypothetical protein